MAGLLATSREALVDDEALSPSGSNATQNHASVRLVTQLRDHPLHFQRVTHCSVWASATQRRMLMLKRQPSRPLLAARCPCGYAPTRSPRSSPSAPPPGSPGPQREAGFAGSRSPCVIKGWLSNPLGRLVTRACRASAHQPRKVLRTREPVGSNPIQKPCSGSSGQALCGLLQMEYQSSHSRGWAGSTCRLEVWPADASLPVATCQVTSEGGILTGTPVDDEPTR